MNSIFMRHSGNAPLGSAGVWRFILLMGSCLFLHIYSLARQAKTLSLNGTWAFRIDPYGMGEKMSWQGASVDLSQWDSLQVPGNWDLRNEYAAYAGAAWYTRTFNLDKATADQQVRLVFQSVYNDATVWVNGNYVGDNHLGFLPFQFDISRYIKAGLPTRLTVRVDNVFKRGALWNWGGIRRAVSLEITPATRLEFQHISAVPDLKTGAANVKLKIVCSNATTQSKLLTVGIRVKRNGAVVSNWLMPVQVPATAIAHEVNWNHVLSKSDVALWHFDFPNLYESEVTLYDGKRVLHTISDRFGIRLLEIKGAELFLNGELVRPVGFNVVPEDRYTGNTLPLERIMEDVDLMKSCGANMARLSHVSLPKEYLDYLDEKGIMVFEEVNLWGKDKLVDPDQPLPKEWLARIIRHNYNHPSIVGWSVGNEIGDEEKNPMVRAYVKGAIQMAKQLDSGRFAVYVSNTAQKNPDDAIEFSDIAMINLYGGWGAGTDRAWQFHKKPVFVSEFGNVLHSEDPNLGTIPIEKMMGQMRNKDYVLGASLWTLNDYRSNYYGQAGWVTPPSQNRPWGIVSTFREKKRSFYDVQREYAPVKNMSFSSVDVKNGRAVVAIEPRGKRDIPANTLRGYGVQLCLVGIRFDTLEINNFALSDIHPGDSLFTISLNWTPNASVGTIHVVLKDPQGYSVLCETKYLTVPERPVIQSAIAASNAVRLYYAARPSAVEYFARYTCGDSVFTTAKTINCFIDVEDDRIKPGAVCAYQLIATNGAGESAASDTMLLAKDDDELPPIVWGNKRVNNAIFVSYSVSPYDYLYEVEYGVRPGVYTAKFSTKLVGVLQLERIEKEKPLFFRIRAVKQWGFASEWSPEYEVK
jgi:beta-galactosidase